MLDRQRRNRLADVAVVMHDLRYGESLKQKVMPVQDGAPGDLRVRQAAAEGTDELIEEQGYAVIDLRVCGGGLSEWRPSPCTA